MGTLRLIEKGFETQTIPPEERDAALRNFIYLKNEIKDQDKIVALQAFYEHFFSFGNIIQDFFFASWEKFHNTDTLKEIQQKTYQLVCDSFAQKPVCSVIDSEATYMKTEFPHSDMGFKQPLTINNYVYDVKTWNQWHLDWLTQHPDLITWEDASNNVFPYPKVIRDILRMEIEKNGVDAVWQTKAYSECNGMGKWIVREEEVTNAFYESVMKHLSPEDRITYMGELGQLICERNHYIYNEKASKIEAKEKKSKRMIFEILKNGKKQYVSLDFQHGMLELLNSNGIHLGEKRLDGTRNTEANASHNFATIEKWKD